MLGQTIENEAKTAKGEREGERRGEKMVNNDCKSSFFASVTAGCLDISHCPHSFHWRRWGTSAQNYLHPTKFISI